MKAHRILNSARGATRARGRSLRVLCWLLSVCACSAFCAPALADDGGDSPQYRKLIAEALQDFDRGNWDEAAALFAQAHTLNPNARTLRGMGLSAFEARHYAEALKHLAAALEDKRRALTTKQRKEVEQSIERAKQYVGRVHFSLEPPETTLRINSEPAQLDAAGELIADPGMLEIEAAAPGYDTQLRRLRVTSGANDEVVIKLVIPRQELPEPVATQEATNPAPAASTATDRESGNAVGTLKWVAGGLAIAGLATGTIALLLRESEANKWNSCLDETKATCTDHRDSANTDKTIGIIGLAAGGVFAITSVVLFVVDANAATDSSARACGPGPGELGVSCHYAF